MRKLKIAFRLLAAMCFAFAPAAAQPTNPEWPLQFAFMLGGESINAGLHSQGKLGLNVGVLAQYPFASSHFALRSDVLLHVFGTFEGYGCVTETGGGSGAQCSGALPRDMLSWSVDAVARLADASARFSPYLLAGGALYVTEGSNGETVPAHYGLQWGAGLDFRTGKTAKILVEWRQMHVAAGSVGPIVFGMRF